MMRIPGDGEGTERRADYSAGLRRTEPPRRLPLGRNHAAERACRQKARRRRPAPAPAASAAQEEIGFAAGRKRWSGKQPFRLWNDRTRRRTAHRSSRLPRRLRRREEAKRAWIVGCPTRNSCRASIDRPRKRRQRNGERTECPAA